MNPAPLDMVGPPWFEVAKREIGVHEVAGAGINPRIAAYYTATDIGRVNDDAVPWCSAFANWAMREGGYKGSGHANARSWLFWGQALKEPKLGCVVVFSRPPNEASGHVAFYVGESKAPGNLMVLGGNQGDTVRVAPYARVRVLGYRWPLPKDMIVPAPAGGAARK